MNNTEISVLVRYAEGLFVNPASDVDEHNKLLIEGRAPTWFLSTFCNNFPPTSEQKQLGGSSSSSFMGIEDLDSSEEARAFFSQLRQLQQSRTRGSSSFTTAVAANANGMSGVNNSNNGVKTILVGASPPADSLEDFRDAPASAIEAIKNSLVNIFQSLSNNISTSHNHYQHPAVEVATHGAISRTQTGLSQQYPSKLAFGGGGGSFVGSHYSGGGLTDSSFAFTNNHSLALSHTASGGKVHRVYSNFNNNTSNTPHQDHLNAPFETANSSQHWWTTAVASSQSLASISQAGFSSLHQYSQYNAPRRARTKGFCVPERPFAAPRVSPLIAWYNQEAHVFVGDALRVQDCLQRVWGLLCLDGGKDEKLPNAKTTRWIIEVLSDQRVVDCYDDRNGRREWSDLTLEVVTAGSRVEYLLPNRPRAKIGVFESPGESTTPTSAANNNVLGNPNLNRADRAATSRVDPTSFLGVGQKNVGPLTRSVVPTPEELAAPDIFESFVRPFCDRIKHTSQVARDFSETTRGDTLSGAIVLFTRFLQKEAELIGREFIEIAMHNPHERVAHQHLKAEDRPLPGSDFTWELPDQCLPPTVVHLRNNQFDMGLALEACLQLVKAEYDGCLPPSGAAYRPQHRSGASIHDRRAQEQMLAETKRNVLLQAYRNHILSVLDFNIVVVAPQVYLEPLLWSIVACPPRRIPSEHLARVKKLAEVLSIPRNVIQDREKAPSESAFGEGPRVYQVGCEASHSLPTDPISVEGEKPSLTLSPPSATQRPVSASVSDVACSVSTSNSTTRTLSLSLSQATRTHSTCNHVSCATSSQSFLRARGASLGPTSSTVCRESVVPTGTEGKVMALGACGSGTAIVRESDPSPASSLSPSPGLVVPTISGLRRHDEVYTSERRQQPHEQSDCADCAERDHQQEWLAAAVSVLPPTIPDDSSWNEMMGYPLTREDVFSLYDLVDDDEEEVPAKDSGGRPPPSKTEGNRRSAGVGGHTPFSFFQSEASSTIDLLMQHSACLAASQHVSWVAGSAIIATAFRLFPSLFTPSVIDAYLHNLELRYGEHVARCVNVAHVITTFLHRNERRN